MAATNPRTRLPNLFIVGAPKCGTTAWVEYLRTHPDIFIPKAKERCYFALDLPNFRLTRTPEDYAELFAPAGDSTVIGEASAMYLFSEAAAEAIRDHDPASRILIFLRDQEDYLPSLHNQFLWEFAEEIEDFDTAWKLSGQRLAETIPSGCLEPRTLDYKAMGRFGEQVARYLAVFPPRQVRVIHFRDWVADPRSTYLEILAFLGLGDDGRADFPPVNQGMTYRARPLTRLIVSPPPIVRNGAQLLKRVARPVARLLERVAWKAVNLLSAQGYKKDIGAELRQEIRDYYADDNRLLERMLASSALASGPPRRRTASR